MKTLVINEKAKESVALLLDELSLISAEKKARILGKSYAGDVRLNNFLNSKFDKGLGIFTDAEKWSKMQDKLANYGITSEKEKIALCISIIEVDATASVTAKKAELVKGLTLNDEQKEALAAKLAEYKSFLENGLRAGARKIGLTLGATDTIIEPVVKALAEA